MAEPENAPLALDASDLPYHRHVVAQIHASQAAIQSWMVFLGTKYHLAPTDQVDSEGRFLRT